MPKAMAVILNMEEGTLKLLGQMAALFLFRPIMEIYRLALDGQLSE